MNIINSLSIDGGCGEFKIKQRHKFLSIYFIFIINMVLHVLLLLKFLNSHRKHNDNAVVQKLRRILMLLIHKPIVCPKIFLLHNFLRLFYIYKYIWVLTMCIQYHETFPRFPLWNTPCTCSLSGFNTRLKTKRLRGFPLHKDKCTQMIIMKNCARYSK